MKRSTKVKILRLIHKESTAHMRARIKRSLKLDMDKARVSNWIHQAESKLY